MSGFFPATPNNSSQFITGSHVKTYAFSSQEPIKLLQKLSPIEKASCVPYIKITEVDPRSGKPIEGREPITIDLLGGPRAFAESQERFLERSLVSLKSLNVSTELSYGTIVFNNVELSFRVHKPDVIFSRESQISWKSLMREGASHSLEYGWTADPKVVKNEIFNGLGFHDELTGLVIKSTKTMLLVTPKYNVSLLPSGEVDVTISGIENGDIALRESRLGDVIDISLEKELRIKSTSQTNSSPIEIGVRSAVNSISSNDLLKKEKIIAGIKRMIDSLPKQEIQKLGTFVRCGDVLNTMIADPVSEACRSFGYSGVDFYAGNFNSRAESQSKNFGGQTLSNRSIADFLIPVDVLVKKLTDQLKVGKEVLLLNFIKNIVSILNGDNAWAESKQNDRQRPEVEVRTHTYKDKSNLHRLVFHILDRIEGKTPFLGDERIPLEEQTRENIVKKLTDKNVPILEFGRGDSVILEANFDIQLEPLLQSILVENAFNDRKNRVQSAEMPDVESRKGQSLSNEIIPFSVLTGEITMVGNFVMDTLAAFWLEFFGASQISGMYRVSEKNDIIEPGKFISTYKVLADGADPLNTRRRRSEQEIRNAEILAAKTRSQKPKKKKSGTKNPK